MAKPTDPIAPATKATPKARPRRRPTKVAAAAEAVTKRPVKVAVPAPVKVAVPAKAVVSAPAPTAPAAEAPTPGRNAASNGAVAAPPVAAPAPAARREPAVESVAPRPAPTPEIPTLPTKPDRQAGGDGRVAERIALASGRAMLAATMRTQQFAGEQMSRACATTRAIATCGSVPAGLALQTQFLTDSAQGSMAYALELAQLASDFWRPSQRR